jgi:hypothetical protein
MGTFSATALAIAAVAIPALPASAASSQLATASGVVTAVSAQHHSFTLHRISGGSLTVTVSSPDLLVHGINAPVSALRPGMTVLAHGTVRGASLTADTARAFTPAKWTTVWTGKVVAVDAGARQIVVQTAPYQTAAAFVIGDVSVNGVRHASLNRLAPGMPVTLTGNTDTVNSSELLASTVTAR